MILFFLPHSIPMWKLGRYSHSVNLENFKLCQAFSLVWNSIIFQNIVLVAQSVASDGF